MQIKLRKKPHITRMSAIGPKRTCTAALHMSAFGGKADFTNLQSCPERTSPIESKSSNVGTTGPELFSLQRIQVGRLLILQL